MKRATALSLAVVGVVASSVMASPASAAPMKKCQNDPENFQIVNGKCVSDGQAEHL